MFVTVVSAICMAYMIVLILSLFLRLGMLDRQGKLNFLKSFKKGKFVLIYLASIPLYWMGFAHDLSVMSALLQAFKAGVDLVFLKFDNTSIAPLLEQNLFYHITVDLCFALVTVNAFLFTFTIFARSLSNLIRKKRYLHFSKKETKKVYLIVGYNDQNKQIIESAAGKGYRIILLADRADDDAEDYAFVQKIAVIRILPQDRLSDIVVEMFSKFDDKSVTVIINTGDDVRNVTYTEQLYNVIENKDAASIGAAFDKQTGLNVFAFGEPQSASVFMHYVKSGRGAIHYINKYKLIAMDFVDRYPITCFMTDDQLDYNTATIKPDVPVNVVMVGFGNTGRELFLTSVANDQLLTIRDGKLTESPINYYIYDKDKPEKNKNLNHSYARFEQEFYGNKKVDEKAYLPIPSKPAHVEYIPPMDINDAGFFSSVRANLSGKEDKKSFNYVIIALGDDMENFDLAEKISVKLCEWGLSGQTKIFVKIKNNALSANVLGNLANKPYVTFGDEKQTVYNLPKIVTEEKIAMAKDVHLMYTFEYLRHHKKADEPIDLEKWKASAASDWYNFWEEKRESNVFACLAIRLKLNLLGFDCVAADDTSFKDATQDYKKRYEENDPIVHEKVAPIFAAYEPVLYSNDIVVGSARYNLTVQEHQRWNAFFITRGFVPPTIEEIKNKATRKNEVTRKHACLTTFEGLVDYRDICAAADNKSAEETDVIRYDYQLMDDLPWILQQHGLKIISKE